MLWYTYTERKPLNMNSMKLLETGVPHHLQNLENLEKSVSLENLEKSWNFVIFN